MKASGGTQPELIKYIRELSLSRLKHFSGREDIQLSEVLVEPLVFAHWMSIILVSGKNLRVIFKVHYMTEVARFFAEKIYGPSQNKISDAQALDFFREYCNLTGGRLKVGLAQNNVKVGVSLPVLARGFDEIYYVRPTGSISNCWSLSCMGQKVECSLHLEVFEDFELKHTDAEDESKSGDVEFL